MSGSTTETKYDENPCRTARRRSSRSRSGPEIHLRGPQHRRVDLDGDPGQALGDLVHLVRVRLAQPELAVARAEGARALLLGGIPVHLVVVGGWHERTRHVLHGAEVRLPELLVEHDVLVALVDERERLRLPSMGGVPSSTTWMPSDCAATTASRRSSSPVRRYAVAMARSRASVSRSSVMSVSTPFCWPWMTRPRRSFSRGSDPMRRWSAVGLAVRAGCAVVPVGAELGQPEWSST